jgi:ferredoxin
MDRFILKKEKLAGALRKLGKDSEIYLPFENERGLVEYRELDDSIEFDRVMLGCKPDVPPKGILFPQSEVLLRYRKQGKNINVEPAPADYGKKIIFGVKPCDAVAISIMDRVFCEGMFVDPYYKTRRENTAIVAIACDGPSDSQCFCPSTGGSPVSKEGADVIMYDLGEEYYFEPVTAKGESIAQEIEHELANPTPLQEEKKNKFIIDARDSERFSRKITDESIQKLDSSFDSDYWQKVARKCIGCGACTYYCPTCHCFDMNDEPGGRRVRTWDSCQFPDFTMHTSGHNPRANRGGRLRNRFYHKFKYSKDSLGRCLCVGCGRCIALCPAGMDITKVIGGVK